MTDNRCIVTEHALVRYLERVRGMDLSIFREEIARLVEPAVAVGASSVTLDGSTYVLCDGRVVTILEGSMRVKHKRPSKQWLRGRRPDDEARA